MTFGAIGMGTVGLAPGALRREALAVAAFLGFGALLLIPNLGSQSLWVDESLTVVPALTAKNLGELTGMVIANDTQPPGSHLILHFLLRGSSPGEFWVRFPSFLGVEAGLLLLYLTVRRLWGSNVALPMLAIAQVSPLLGFYAAEARPYGMWFAAVCGSMLVAVHWWESLSVGDSGRVWRRALVWGLIGAAGCWLNLMNVFVILGETAVMACGIVFLPTGASSRRVAASSLLAGLLLAGGLFSPWLVSLAARPEEVRSAVGWTRQFAWSHLVYQAFAQLVGFSWGPSLSELHQKQPEQILRRHFLPLLAALIAGGIVVYLYGERILKSAADRKRHFELLPLLLFPSISMAGPVMMARLWNFPLHPRHLLFLHPLLPLVLALAWAGKTPRRFLVGGITLLQVWSLGNLLLNETYSKDNLRDAIRFAESSSTGPAYILAEGAVAEYYCRTARGRGKNFTHFEPGTEYVWFLDNRPWEPENARFRRRLQESLQAAGFSEQGVETRFRGIHLRHWRAFYPAAGNPSSDSSDPRNPALRRPVPRTDFTEAEGDRVLYFMDSCP